MTASDPKYTKVGCGLFAWEPYVRLRRADGTGNAAHLWQVLWMSAPAKLLLPGLWMGGIGTMADHARMTHQETYEALQTCIAREMVEYDDRTQVLRLTALPDRSERAPNQSCLRGWWDRRQQIVPDCGVRDRHLELMAWLHLPFQASKRSTNQEMQRAWDETFGTALNTSPAPILSTTLSPDRPSSASPSQLDLYATPSIPHGGGDRGGDGPVTVKETVPEKEKGEVQERGRPDADPTAVRFGLLELDRPMSGEPAGEVWLAVKQRFLSRESAQNAAMWIDPITATLEGDTCQLHAPNDFVRRWVRDKYAHDLQDDLRAVTGRQIQVAI